MVFFLLLLGAVVAGCRRGGGCCRPQAVEDILWPAEVVGKS